MKKDHENADDHVGEHEQHAVPAGRDQPPQDPRIDLADAVRLRLLDVGLDGVEESRDGDPSENQPGGVPQPGHCPSQRVRPRDGQGRTDKAGERHDVDADQR